MEMIMKWEYYVFDLEIANSSHGVREIGNKQYDFDIAYAKDINEISKEGWELICVDRGMAYFRQPLKPKHELMKYYENRSSLV